MGSDNRPASAKQSPDPATSYERAKPEPQAGRESLGPEDVIPEDQADRGDDAVPNRQKSRQVNSQSDQDQRIKIDPEDRK